MFRSFSLLVICTLLVPCDFLHSQIVVRDSIGPDSSLTDGLPGGSTNHDGSVWNTPGLVIDVPTTGFLEEARFVIFNYGIDHLVLFSREMEAISNTMNRSFCEPKALAAGLGLIESWMVRPEASAQWYSL